MKYQSELINEILEDRGHEKSSLHYESECIESWIEENKGSYPKLCDYQSEWLNYINENPIGNFPYEIITTNSTTTINNVVPLAYKSAILSGNTLVNKMNNATYRTGINADIKPNDNNEFINTDNGGDGYNILPIQSSVFESNKIYTIILFLDEIGDGGLDKPQLFAGKDTMLKIGVNKALYTTSPSVNDMDYSHNTQITNSFKARYMIIEGDYTNVDIPYFEGMQSVKMPVLTTTGKNLFDGEMEIGGIDDYGLPTPSTSQNRTKKYIEVEPNTNYSLSRLGSISFNIFYYDENKNFISKTTWLENKKTPINCKYVKFATRSLIETDIQIQFEQSINKTTYEPYKSNILTVNEEVELRGIGDVKDELDLLTGEVTERIGYYKFTGDENFRVGNYYGDEISFLTKTTDYMTNSYIPTNGTDNDFALTTGFRFVGQSVHSSTEESKNMCMSVHMNGETYFRLRKDLLDTVDVDGFKKFIKNNPTEIVIKLSKESVKTVDLMIINQDGETISKIKPFEGTMNIKVTGSPIAPTATLEIPVEAITQNLNSFIDLETGE